MAAYDQGAHVTYIGPSGSQIGQKESMKDTARVLDGCMMVFSIGLCQKTVEELPNTQECLSERTTNEFHPTQVLADFMTVQEHMEAAR